MCSVVVCKPCLDYSYIKRHLISVQSTLNMMILLSIRVVFIQALFLISDTGWG